ncbi:hypothetical protein FH972_006042 [Carpinus fangiana]|uniref:Uncharacterized protein n=1 Tax=Carpinus fangiana TaxID=176857 RepID=A0A5N6QRE0_9ROSI|nr:hypothetical protein FH972_006042 [Carpinus fangiana]
MRERDDVHPSSRNPSKRDIDDVGGPESAQPWLGIGLGHVGFRGSRPNHRFRLGFLLLLRIWEVADFGAVVGNVGQWPTLVVLGGGRRGSMDFGVRLLRTSSGFC